MVPEPLPPTFEEPRFYCRNDGETMTLVDIQWTVRKSDTIYNVLVYIEYCYLQVCGVQ